MKGQDWQDRYEALAFAYRQQVREIHADYSDRMKAADKQINELKIVRNTAERARHEALEAVKDAYCQQRAALDEEFIKWKEEQRTAGMVSRTDFNAAVLTIWKYLQQKGNDGLIIGWSDSQVCEIRFRPRIDEETLAYEEQLLEKGGYYE